MRFRIGYQILYAVILSILAGLFFGPYCSSIAWIGDAYVTLLQMAIIPFIPLSLIHGIGSLSLQMAKNLFRHGWYFIPLLWLLALLVIYLLSLPIPTTESIIISKLPGAERGVLNDLLSTIAPKNAFYDIANNILPAVALFGVLSGVAMLFLKKKEPLLPVIEKFLRLLERFLDWLALFSPIAIFVHISVAVGTTKFSDLVRLQSYIGLTILGTLFLALFVLPKLLSSLGPFSYKELLKEARIPCLIGFATGVPSVAFPFMLRTIRRLMHKHELHHENLHSASQTVIPFAYSFTQLGNLFLYLFILFMSFFLREALQESESFLLPLYILFLSLGAPSKSINGISFLTEHLQWPKETIDYYLTTNALTQNFQVFLSVAGMLCFTLLVLLGYYKAIKIQWKKLIFNFCAGVAMILGLVTALKILVHPKDRFQDFFLDLSIFDVLSNPVPFKLETKTAHSSSPIQNPLERILETKVLKVGYDTLNIPYCYINNNHELAGYDIASAFRLAKDLDCSLEFIPMNRNLMGEELNAGVYDIIMSAIILDQKRLLAMDFSHPYAKQQNVLVVARNRSHEFVDYRQIKAMPNLKIGAMGDYKLIGDRFFPEATKIEEMGFSDLLSGKIDAFIWSKTPAFVWCLGNRNFVVLDLGDTLGQLYFAYPVKQGALNWANFLDEWLQLRTQSGFLEQQKTYWLEGKPSVSGEAKWSVIRNVLHWVN